MLVFQTYIPHPKCVVKATKTMLLKEDTSERCEVNVTAKRKKEKQKKGNGTELKQQREGIFCIL